MDHLRGLLIQYHGMSKQEQEYTAAVFLYHMPHLLKVFEVAEKHVYSVVAAREIDDVWTGPHFWELKDVVDKAR